MISKLIIRNFQAHEKFKLEFDPHITTIIGPSDVGKSALIRALKWVCLNQPQGKSFIRHGQTEVAVQLTVDDRKIARKRDASDNTYILDGKEYRAFGSDVPGRIADLLNLGPINFQGQHDPPFWFSCSAGEVSRSLNSIVDLGVIDTAQATIGRTLRRQRETAAICEERLTEAKKQRDELEWVEECTQGLEIVAQLSEEKSQLAEEMANLLAAIHSVEDSKKTVDESNQKSTELESLQKLVGNYLELTAKSSELIGFVHRIKRLEDASKLAKIDTSSLDRKFQAYNKVAKKKDALFSLIGSCIRLKKESETTKRKKDQALETLNEATADGCPICGGELKNV